MKTIIMPQVGQDVPSAAIVEWLKKEGDAVKKGEPVLVIESDKATFEIEAETDGVLLKTLFNAGDVVEIFKPVGYIGQIGETVGEQAPVTEAPAVEIQNAPSRPAEAVIIAEGQILASPSVRRLAREKGVDLSQITGSGPGGRIIVKDVLEMLDSQPSNGETATADERVEAYSKMRKRIAERMSLSTRTIPHFYLFIDVDMTHAAEWRETWNTSSETKLSFNDILIYVVAKALRAFPRINSRADDHKLVLKKAINIGLAVSVEEGLLVPVIAHADHLDLKGITQATCQAIEAARRGTLESNASGTFTITSLGMYGIQKFLPIINPPEAAILGIGAVEPRVVPVDGAPGIRQMMTLTLGADHRAFDGAYGAQFLNRIKQELESIE